MAPRTKVTLSHDFDPGYTADFVKKKEAAKLLAETVKLLSAYQVRLAAQDNDALLLCLQALDAAGKDSTIRHVMSGVNPQGVRVHSFKEPTSEELSHDYLWRYAKRLPARGEIGIFNRSHYEEVLVVRVHPELLEHQRLPRRSGGQRSGSNDSTRSTTGSATCATTAFGCSRYASTSPRRNSALAFSAGWTSPTTTGSSPPATFGNGSIGTTTNSPSPTCSPIPVPSGHPGTSSPPTTNGSRALCVGAVLVHTLMAIDPRFPEVTLEQRQEEHEARAWLLAEAPHDVPAP